MESHTLCSLEAQSCDTTQGLPPIGSVRLSDGCFQVDITFGTSCLKQPLQNNAKLLSRFLGLPIVTDHQVFDSLDHLIRSLVFTVPGTFFGWDDHVHSYLEEYEMELGHLAKINFQMEGESALLEVVVEFEEFREVESHYEGAKARRHGVEITVSGGTVDQRVKAALLFQETLDGYVCLLAPGFTPENA